MKKDIPFLPVKDVTLAVVKRPTADEEAEWVVYLINRNDQPLENVMVTSKGYGELDGEQQKTSTLRHMFPLIDVGGATQVESIHPQVFGLNNEYWVSYFIGRQLYDKKYIFVPDTILEDNLSYIDEIGLEGVLHP
ncbi:MAG: hypothetical protein ACMVP2_13120 [Imperialibacter sp.]|mgnify:FL=1|uniref:hypothetical protein n=1 Tax=Imperialibacter sp. TaxID=2038411 RepID=UPI0030D91F85|tara:strand:+ start:3199 stop:3603 length:405 start_codon:yes stop_codon:yes gene_type:complete